MTARAYFMLLAIGAFSAWRGVATKQSLLFSRVHTAVVGYVYTLFSSGLQRGGSRRSTVFCLDGWISAGDGTRQEQQVVAAWRNAVAAVWMFAGRFSFTACAWGCCARSGMSDREFVRRGGPGGKAECAEFFYGPFGGGADSRRQALARGRAGRRCPGAVRWSCCGGRCHCVTLCRAGRRT
jgi:hypothetical protein